jgi:polysaccharide biosynthesis/export protein
MKRVLIVLFALFFILNSGSGIVKAAEEYRLSPGDVLAISVWGIEDLKLEGMAVREDGKIAIPLVGEVQVAGLLPSELMEVISSDLNGYVNNPKVTVNILKYHTTRIYVVGEVAKPGVYELEKQHKLIDAITVAGGYTKDAAKKKVIVMSQGGTSKPLEVNLLALLKKGDMTQNISLKDEDIVYLTGNGRIDLGRDIMPVIGFWSVLRNF